MDKEHIIGGDMLKGKEPDKRKEVDWSSVQKALSDDFDEETINELLRNLDDIFDSDNWGPADFGELL